MMRDPLRRPSRRLLSSLVPALLVGALVLLPSTSVLAGPDDFEFGQRLAERKFYDLARRVYDGVLADSGKQPAEKDAARYGLVLLARHQAQGATTTDASYADIKALFEKAVQEVDAFVKANPQHEKANEAKIAVGTIRLAFVTFCEQLLNDAEEAREHAASLDTVRDDAKRAVEDTIKYFERFKDGDDEFSQLARYNWVVCQYYRALVLPPCSPEASGEGGALKSAARILEEYASDNDGRLVAVYAQDILGLVFWKIAECENDPKLQEKAYQDALSWFDTCIETPNDGDQYLRVITNGYYHAGQVCLEAGKIDKRFWREGADRISKMNEKHQTAWRTENGLRALVEWSKLECARGDAQKAISIANDAADRAKAVQLPHLERVAGRQLNLYVSGQCGGGATAGSNDPAVLQRVADDLFFQAKYPEAIRAYRSVVLSLGDSPKAFVDLGVPAWQKVSESYRQMGDLLGAALALEPIHEAWMDGRLPHKEGESNDPNLVNAGNARNRAISLLQDLGAKTASNVFKARAAAMQSAFATEYPNHPSTGRHSMKSALAAFNEARDLKRRKDPGASAKFADARKFFQIVTAEPALEERDTAWSYLVQLEVSDAKLEDALTAAAKAEAYWDSPAAKADAEKYPNVRATRELARARARFWKGEALSELKRWDQVLATLKDFPKVGKDETLPQRAQALVVEGLLEQGKIQEADAEWQKLLTLDSKWPGLANVAHRFAAHYTTQYKDIETEFRGIEAKLRGAEGITKRLLRKTAEADRAANAVGDKINLKATLERLIQVWNKSDSKDPNERSGVRKEDYEAAKKKVPELEKEIAADQEKGRKLVGEKDALQKESDQLVARRDELRKSLYGPLTKAAGYYKQWDDALKAAGAERDAENLSGFGAMFYTAAGLDASDAANWAAARSFYEDFLAHPKIKDLPPVDPKKRAVVAKLGDVYVHFAETEKDPEARRVLIAKSVEFLQNALAQRAENNALMVGILTREIVVIPFEDPGTEPRRTFRIPIRKVKDVAALKDEVKKLGTPTGTPQPVFAVKREADLYGAALERFKVHVLRQDEAVLKEAVSSMEKAGIDWAFYREHANPDVDFRLALAWSYAESGRPEDLPKAVWLTESLVNSSIAAEEQSEEWWKAYTTRFRAYLALAEANAAAGGTTPTGTQSQWLENAAKMVKSLHANFADLGDTTRPGTRQEWHALLQRLNSLRGRANLMPVTLNLLEKKPSLPPDPGEEPKKPDAEKPADKPAEKPDRKPVEKPR